MSLADLQTIDWFHPESKVLSRRLKKTSTQLQKTVARRVKKTRTKALSFLRNQYYPTNAYADLKNAFARNEDICITSIMTTTVLCYALANTAASFLFLFFSSSWEMSSFVGIDISMLLPVALGVLAALGIWVCGFIFNILSLAVMEGLSNKKYRSVRSTFRTSLKRAARTSSAWLFLGMIFFLPLVFGAILTAIYVRVQDMTIEQAMSIVPFAIIATMTWLVIASMQLGLSPYIALFEPGLNMTQVFRRSSRLVKTRGRIFLLSIYGLLGLTLAGGYAGASLLEKLTGISSALPFMLFSLLSLIVTNGIMVVFYRKRRLARK